MINFASGLTRCNSQKKISVWIYHYKVCNSEALFGIQILTFNDHDSRFYECYSGSDERPANFLELLLKCDKNGGDDSSIIVELFKDAKKYATNRLLAVAALIARNADSF